MVDLEETVLVNKIMGWIVPRIPKKAGEGGTLLGDSGSARKF